MDDLAAEIIKDKLDIIEELYEIINKQSVQIDDLIRFTKFLAIKKYNLNGNEPV